MPKASSYFKNKEVLKLIDEFERFCIRIGKVRYAEQKLISINYVRFVHIVYETDKVYIGFRSIMDLDVTVITLEESELFGHE